MIQKNKYVFNIICIILAYISTLSILFQQNGKFANNISFVGLLIFGVLYFIYKKYFGALFIKIDFLILFLGAIYSVFTLIGVSYTLTNSAKLLTGNVTKVVISCIAFVGFCVLYYVILDIILKKVLLARRKKYVFAKNFNLKYPILFFALIIFITWLPYLIIFYPGSIPYDGYYQLDMFFGIWPMSDHHPVLTTYLIGGFVSLGSIIDLNFGVFLFVLFQSVLCAFIYGYISAYINSLKINKLFPILTLLFFSLLPMWGAYAQTVGKDTLYYAFFALFFTKIVQIVMRKNAITKKEIIGIVLLSCLLIIFRKDGLFIVLPTLIGTLFVIFRSKLKIVLSIILILIINMVYGQILTPNLIETKGAPYEAHSVFFQQTARAVKYHGDDLTEDERRSIDKVLNYDTLVERYNPCLSDPVKSKANLKATDEEFAEYMDTWKSMLYQYPGDYISATINNCFGYFYPPYIYEELSAFKFYIMGEPLNTGELKINYIMNNGVRTKVMECVTFVQHMPGISLLMTCGTYTWILLASILFILKSKRYKFLVITIPLIFNVLICVASPVNAYIRYSMPLMAAIPVLIACVYYIFGLKKEEAYG
ncbi:Uncharacterised protein [uncultured Roseburia sp.]|uniref:DUF6020 family protein n=1 Tax=Brotonthovivens ammoniilytica TaxID=2981725 RepID=A0ABT2TKD1_9FIRM|nr:DUF6020 family protein [Brotonthovivens ammoniilytica]MCU6762670.1 DUF6020 family protein [Brotonthovivens ammoniilytica]SCI84160.1 Uncharacterised protein [uncultured Roseburia sp.]